MSPSSAFLIPLPLRSTGRARTFPHKATTPHPARRTRAVSAPAADEPPAGEPSNGSTIDVEPRPVPLQSLKSDLYLQLSSSSLGFSVPTSQKSQIMNIITSLESRNPTPETSYSPLLLGKWRLLYTTARDVLSLSLLSPFVSTGQVYQNIAPKGEEFDIENVVYFRPPFAPLVDIGTEGMLRVEAKGVVKDANRVDLTFEKAFIRQMTVAGLEVPEKLRVEVPINGPVGYLDTTFLDEDIRIGRAPMVGNDENVFILAREE